MSDWAGTIVIPVLNEGDGIAHSIEQLLARLSAGVEQPAAQQTLKKWQIVVVDGGSRDDTVAHLQHFPVQVIVAAPGRARQMNAGAARGDGELIVFLHGDTQLPENFLSIMDSFQRSAAHWGRFDVQLNNPARSFALISWFMNQRSRFTGVCTGDQALFMRRDFFNLLGGFADIPLMEDVEFSLRACRISKPYRAKQPVLTSARRWVHHGVVKTVMLMWWLRLAYRMGISPQRLHRWYYRRSG